MTINTSSSDGITRFVIETTIEIGVLDLVTPWVDATRSPTRGLFPLLLRRETSPAPSGVCMSIPPVNSHYRAIRVDHTSKKLSTLEGHTIVLIPLVWHIRDFFSGLIRMTYQFCLLRICCEICQKFCVFRDCHFKSSDPKFWKFDFTAVLKRELPGRNLRHDIEIPNLWFRAHDKKGNDRPRDDQQPDQ